MQLGKKLGVSALAVLGIAAGSGAMSAARAAEADDVVAASEGFYQALAVIDDGTAMGAVWAHAPYVTFIGPRSEVPIVGWEAQKQYWTKANTMFRKRAVALSDRHVHVEGALAWEVGVESADVELKDGTARHTANLVTNVYEKTEGRWLMVSHHAQPRP